MRMHSPRKLCPALLAAALLGTPAAATLRPSALLSVPSNGAPKTVILVEKDTQTLYLYECLHGNCTLAREMPCTTGKVPGDKQYEGDLRTPEGIYWFERYIPGDALPALYGAGALTMDYPNQFDRLSGKTGGGIWLHGVESDDRVQIERDTRGCVAVRNDHFKELLAVTRLHETPILVAKDIELDEAAELEREADELRALLADWKDAWESKDLPRYARHYEPRFRSGAVRLSEWIDQKVSLADRYRGIRIGIDDVTILRDGSRAWASFRQEYASDGHRDVGRKTLALLHGTDGWKIVDESWVALDDEFTLIDPNAPFDPVSAVEILRDHPDAAPPPAVGPVLVASAEPTPTITAPIEETAEPAVVQPPSQETPPTATHEDQGSAAHAHRVRPGIVPVVLQEPDFDRDIVRLIGPFARVLPGGELELQVQLLNSRPTSRRGGTVTFEARTGTTHADPFRESREFSIRQGDLLTVALPLPEQPGSLRIDVSIDDASGRTALEQAVVVELE